VRKQHGVFRTNCMDCLDRTNVVQSVIARRVLVAQLSEAGILAAGDDLGMLEPIFKHAWADNADAMSFHYSGTGALKTDYTRTGKRTRAGAIRDLTNSARRYYLNNFADGDNHDALELFLGHFVPDVDRPSPFTDASRAQRSLKPVLIRAFALVLALLAALTFVAPGPESPFALLGHNGVYMLLFIALLPFISFKLALRGGRKHVNRPKLGTDDPLSAAAAAATKKD
jgi:hypothetical protein